MRLAGVLVLLASALSSYSYIPASPTNSTRDAIAGGLNITDISKLHLQWFSNGSYSEYVSYQLVGNGSLGISKGVLVHFSEEKANNLTAPSATPWIALVSCDKNASDASMDEDIFTLARDKGAVSALLYSLNSVACIINPEYTDPATFDQVFDIFSTQSLTSAHLIEYQFGQLGAQNKSIFAYDSQQLNNSADDISRSFSVGYPVSSGYLLAVLQASNAVSTDPSSAGTSGAPNDTRSGSPNTALAMIVLYAITGCVSALFCIVIISGAVRAIRHPERYGPRARFGDNGAPPQSRARGLTRAFLDTFPLVKFGDAAAGSQQDLSQPPKEKDPENPQLERKIEFGSFLCTREDASTEAPPADRADCHTRNASVSISAVPNSAESSGSVGSQPAARGNNSDASRDHGEGSSRDVLSALNQVERDDVVPASIGRETCPICIVDFEEGDDIRVLPCEGKHCFHQQCVDPWLLKLSSSCPICRHDFMALENMLAGNSDDDEVEDSDPRVSHHGQHGTTGVGRFSRYLRFAHHRQLRRRDDNADPTDPYMPTAPETSVYSGM